MVCIVTYAKGQSNTKNPHEMRGFWRLICGIRVLIREICVMDLNIYNIYPDSTTYN